MDQPRSYRFYTKRSEHYDNLEKREAEIHKSYNNNKLNVDSKSDLGEPLKDNTNIQKSIEGDSLSGGETDNSRSNFSPNKVLPLQTNILSNSKEKRPLKCLETLAQKAGISLDEKGDTVTLDKPQSPAQGGAAQQQQQVPFQISHEQLQQMQLQFQQPFSTIQVKQEYPNHQANSTHLTDQQMQVLEGQTQGQHQVPTSMSLNQTGTTTINTLSPLQAMSGQVSQEWQNRVQVLPQTIQNTPYLQQLYAGQPVVMTGNVIPGIGGQQQIQLIAASGKTFQSSPMATQQMITNSQGKQVISGSGTFSGAYTLPTIPSSQSQTLVLSPLSMISSQNQQGQNVMSSINTSQNTNKPEQMQKQIVTSQKMIKSNQQTNVNQNTPQGQQCVQVPSAMQTTQLFSPLQQAGQTMQFTAPGWIQGACQMPFWPANGLQSQILPPNSILIRGTNPDGTQGIFIQQAQTPQQAVQQTQAQNQAITQLQCGLTQQKPVRPVNDNGTPKQIARAPTLLPQGATPPIRPASSVSTQTAQTPNTGILTPKTGKVRTSKHTIRPPGPLIKQDLGQTKVNHNTPLQQVITSTGNKMVVMSTEIGINGNAQMQQNVERQQQLRMAYQQQLAKNQQVQLQKQQQELQQQFALQMQNQSHSQQQLNQNNIAQFALQMQTQSPSQQQLSQNSMTQFQLTATSQAQPVGQNTLIQGQSQGLVLQGQQMVLHNQNGQTTLTMAPNNLISQQTSTSVNSQQLNIQPKPVSQSSNITSQYEKISMPASSVASVTQNVSNSSIMSHVNSSQNQIQPPQNPLIAMTNLSTSPLSVGSPQLQPSQKDSVDQRNTVSSNLTTQTTPTVLPQKNNIGDTNNTMQSVKSSSQTSSPLKVSTAKTSTDEKTESLSAIIGSSEPSEQENTGNSSFVATPTPSVSIQSSISVAKTVSAMSPSMITTTVNSSVNGVNSTSVNISSKNEKGLPKAMVKPNVLTHVIEGFVIQESQEPFPVNRQRYSDRDEHENEPPKKKTLTVVESEPSLSTEKVSCANCGKLELKSKLKRKKYCSFSCSKSVKNDIDSGEDMKTISTNSSSCETIENGNKVEDSTIKTDTPIGKWTAKEVCKFIAEVLGTDEYSEDFTTQEIDGSALILLKEKHLVNAMGMKLGPALKIVAKVQSLLSLNAETSVQQSPSTTTANQ